MYIQRKTVFFLSIWDLTLYGDVINIHVHKGVDSEPTMYDGGLKLTNMWLN